MARLAKVSAAVVDVRAYLIARLELSLELRPLRAAFAENGGVFVDPRPERLERLRRGDPVVVQSYQLPAEVAALWPRQRVRVAADGSLSGLTQLDSRSDGHG